MSGSNEKFNGKISLRKEEYDFLLSLINLEREAPNSSPQVLAWNASRRAILEHLEVVCIIR